MTVDKQAITLSSLARRGKSGEKAYAHGVGIRSCLIVVAGMLSRSDNCTLGPGSLPGMMSYSLGYERAVSGTEIRRIW